MTATARPVLEKDSLDGIDPERWGLSLEAVQSLGRQLFDCWDRFHDCFTTRTRDTSAYAHVYLKGLLLLPEERNYANIARRIIDSRTPGWSQVGTTWLPLPHLLMIPLVRNDWLWSTGLAGAIVSGVSMTTAAAFLFASVHRILSNTAAAATAAARCSRDDA